MLGWWRMTKKFSEFSTVYGGCVLESWNGDYELCILIQGKIIM